MYEVSPCQSAGGHGKLAPQPAVGAGSKGQSAQCALRLHASRGSATGRLKSLRTRGTHWSDLENPPYNSVIAESSDARSYCANDIFQGAQPGQNVAIFPAVSCPVFGSFENDIFQGAQPGQDVAIFPAVSRRVFGSCDNDIFQGARPGQNVAILDAASRPVLGSFENDIFQGAQPGQNVAIFTAVSRPVFGSFENDICQGAQPGQISSSNRHLLVCVSSSFTYPLRVRQR